MKKYLLIFVSIALSLNLNAQTLVGKWYEDFFPPDDPEMSMKLSVTFSEDQTFLLDIFGRFQYSDTVETSVDVQVLMYCEGTWSLSGNELTQKYGKWDTDAKILKCEGISKIVAGMFRDSLKLAVKRAFKDRLKGPITKTVHSLTNDQVIFTWPDSEQADTLYREQ